MGLRLLAAAMLVLWSVTGSAADGGEPHQPDTASAWGMQQLMQEMAEVKSAHRKFTERKYLSVLTAPLQSSGTLDYRAPARLEKHTLLPKQENLILDQGIIIIENKARQVRRTMMISQYPAIGAFVESIRATLAGDMLTLNRYFQVKLEGNAAHWHLQLLPNDQATREVVREVRMEGHGKFIDSVEILEANGDHSVMTVTEGTTSTRAGQ
jgi:hypothetical protein